MRRPETLPTNALPHWQEHTLDVSQLCPISRNPRAGSTITIGYQTAAQVLEVGSLFAYVAQYQDGLKNETGEIIVRSMEEMVSMVARHCAEALGVPVEQIEVTAKWNIVPYQSVRMQFGGSQKESEVPA